MSVRMVCGRPERLGTFEGVDYRRAGRPRIKQAVTPSLSCHEGDARRSAVTVQLVLTVRVAAMQLPLRVLLALFVLGAFGGIAVWGFVAVLRVQNMTQSQRMMAVAGIVIIMAALAVWVIFLWPVYWD